MKKFIILALIVLFNLTNATAQDCDGTCSSNSGFAPEVKAFDHEEILEKLSYNYGSSNIGVHGKDGREIINRPDTDYRTSDLKVGKLTISKGDSDRKVSSCTATLIAPNVVITAVHCFHNAQDNTIYNDQVYFELQTSGNHKPYDYVMAKEVYVAADYWEHYDEESDPNKIDPKQISDDYAIVVLEENIGDEVGWHEIEAQEEIEEEIKVAGYPGSKKGKMTYQECTSEENQKDYRRSYIDCDVTKGNSGGALLSKRNNAIYGIVSTAGTFTNQAKKFVYNDVEIIRSVINGRPNEDKLWKYELYTKKDYTLTLKNNCDKKIISGFRVYKNGEWSSDYGYSLNPGETITISKVEEPTFYAYAKLADGNGQWKGNHKHYVEEYSRKIPYFKKDMNINAPIGNHTQTFSCN
jgi:V8-like Glu-specific endopeptidase